MRGEDMLGCFTDRGEERRFTTMKMIGMILMLLIELGRCQEGHSLVLRIGLYTTTKGRERGLGTPTL